MKKVTALFATVLLLFITACTTNSTDDTKVNITPPSYTTTTPFSFAAYMTPPQAGVGVEELRTNPDYITEEQYRYMKECGFDTAIAIYEHSIEDVQRALDFCEQFGIKYLPISRGSAVTFSNLILGDKITELTQEQKNELEAKMDLVKAHPAFAGYTAIDEPGAASFDNIAVLKEWYENYLPDKEFFVNLLPLGAAYTQIGGYPADEAEKNHLYEGRVGYERYVNELLEKVNPDKLCFDYYPLTVSSSGNPKLGIGHLVNLEIYADIAKANSIPFHNFLLTMGHWGYRTPNNYSDLAFQVYTSMAYGSRGNKTFTYWTTMSTGENITHGLIDWYGNRTQVYYSMQQVISEIRAMESYYSNFDWQETVAFTSNEDYFNQMYEMLVTTNTATASTKKPITGVASMTGSEDYILGHFKDSDSRNGYMISNIVDPAFDITNEITITFENAKEILICKKGRTIQKKISGGVYKTTLGGGEGQFVIPLY